jgi:RNase P/RNase MRP subunit POP5
MKVRQKPSERIHRRYLLISGASLKNIEDSVLEGIGVLGWAKSMPLQVKDKKIKKGMIVVAVRRESVNEIRASFELSGFKGKIEKVSGTLNGLFGK